MQQMQSLSNSLVFIAILRIDYQNFNKDLQLSNTKIEGENGTWAQCFSAHEFGTVFNFTKIKSLVHYTMIEEPC